MPAGVLGLGGPAAAAGAGLLLDGGAGPLKVRDFKLVKQNAATTQLKLTCCFLCCKGCFEISFAWLRS
jgi:hypothetical protein